MKNLTHLMKQHGEQIEEIRRQLATNFDAPAQRIINAGFLKMGLDRFDREGNDVWEMIECEHNGWEYEKPPAALIARWSCQ